MGTRKNTGTTQKIDCRTCGNQYTTMCDYRQGRCPHHPAVINISIKRLFTNLIKFLQGNKNGTN